MHSADALGRVYEKNVHSAPELAAGQKAMKSEYEYLLIPTSEEDPEDNRAVIKTAPENSSIEE